jgi:hypothetical protein
MITDISSLSRYFPGRPRGRNGKASKFAKAM